MLKVSEAASLALHTMALLADSPNRITSTKEIASTLDVSEAHLSKVLQRLGRVGLVKSIRGPKGGFQLGRPRDSITLLEVYESIDGPFGRETCLLGNPVCGGSDCCILGDLLSAVHRQAKDHLSGATLSDLAATFGGNRVEA